jgi:hypothetical protein
LEKFLEKLDVEISDQADGGICIVNQYSSITQVQSNRNEGLVHGQNKESVPLDTGLVTQSIPEGLAQTNPHVFDQMMIVYLDISFGFDGQIEKSMLGEEGKHMIEKGYSCRNFPLARSIQTKINLDLGFFRVSFDYGCS